MGNAITLAFLFLVAITVFKGARIVPQGSKWVVQRLGKFQSTLGPGLNFIIPFIDSVAYKVTTKDIVMEVPAQEVITRDNVVIVVNAMAFINIISPEKAVYGVENYTMAIQNLVQTSLRSITGEMNLDDALCSRDMIKTKLKATISDDIADWGITLKSVEIQDIKPSSTMQSAMEEQAAAERQRRAAVTRADGEKQAAILQAEGRVEASKRDAEAQVILARASQRSIEMVTLGIGDKELPVLYLLGENYVRSLERMSQSPNAKTVVLPADLPNAVRGLMGKKD
jgi:regulator of protease activity HflC (stomatin/prohibitin superfamily)